MDVIMPQLGETVEEGTVSVWHKKVGDQVKAGDDLFDISTDKVEMEIPAPVTGELVEIHVVEGETVAVGVTVAVINDGKAASAAPAAAAPDSAPVVAAAPAPSTTTAAPRRQIGTRDARGVPLSPAVRKLLAEHDLQPEEITGTGRDGRITRQDVLARIASGAGSDGEIGNRDGRGLPLSPVVRRLLSENNLTPDAVTGTGRDGRIKRDDVLSHLDGAGAKPAAKSVGGRTVVPFDNIRKLTAEHMVRSKATSPHVLQAVEVDFHAVDRARLALKDVWKQQHGFSLTYLPFIAKAVCEAMIEFPRINAHVEGESLVLFDQINLGIAVDLNFEGLMVPVVKDAGSKSIAELATGIRELSEKARSKKLGPDDFAGGTYTISNSGTFGTMITAPVISQPQVAILSMDGVSKKPVVIDVDGSDAIAIRPVGVLAQSFDHRAVDGAYSAAFLKKVRDCLQDSDWRVDLA
ncbi:MAG: dihydrolipoyllysine-residue succinyltransferase [Alphaproteobacteria bacterium]|nr:dihydrolipoyllysine-residue succinyltransferase [Alphaproteobacteria bacterium]